MNSPTWSLLIVQTSVFAVWTASFAFYFDRANSTKSTNIHLLGLVGLMLMLIEEAALYVFRVDAIDAIYGISTYAISVALFLWSLIEARMARLGLAFTVGKSKTLLTRGPYRWIRHPIYASYIIGWCAFAVAVQKWPALIPAGVMTIFYVRAARLEERQLLADKDFGERYAAYMRQAGMFAPRLRLTYQ